MMIYCVADIHGRLDLFEQMLETIRFSSHDFMYVLGDCIDRGGGLAVLDRVMEMQENGQAQFIPGNHEMNFVANISKFNSSLVSKLYYGGLLFESNKSKDRVSVLSEYWQTVKKQQSGDPVNASAILTMYDTYITYDDYFNHCDLEKRRKVMDFITSAPTHIDIEVNKRTFRLLHAGCKPDGTPDAYVREEFYRNPSPLENTTVIFGHVPTREIRTQTEGIASESSIWYDSRNHNDKIGVDCGCCFSGGKLACLRLDDMKEYYIDNHDVFYETEEEIIGALEEYAL